jgi:hypothetical protein
MTMHHVPLVHNLMTMAFHVQFLEPKMQLAPKLGTELRLEPTLKFGIGVGLYHHYIG